MISPYSYLQQLLAKFKSVRITLVVDLSLIPLGSRAGTESDVNINKICRSSF